jgi:DNA-binding CsgD family transcriptional regulator
LTAAADRLRRETRYRFRFRAEQDALEAAIAAARDRLGSTAAEEASTAGGLLDWREASAYALRARGERKRPRHGWASLTPTEVEVALLAVDDLTNRQIAERLLMGTETVKTHLARVYDKLGVRTRTGLAKHVPASERQNPTH